jgi:hypothetical protein
VAVSLCDSLDFASWAHNPRPDEKAFVMKHEILIINIIVMAWYVHD